MEKTINFDFYYGHEAEQFTFYRIPVAHGYKKGMETQTGLAKALNEMGFYTHGSNNTAQMQWEKAENDVLEAEVTKEKVVLEYLYSKFPKASEMARIRIYEYNFKNKEMFGHKQDGIWMIKNPDGKEVEIWQFLKDYAKECTQNNAEIDISNSLLRLMDMLVII